MPTAELEDLQLACQDCGKDFTFSAHSRQVFLERGWVHPKRCMDCRKANTRPIESKDVHGSVKWFDTSKGYGFLTNDEGGDDAYVHFHQINSSDQRRDLVAGQRVIFDLTEGRGGKPAATNVRVVSESEARA